MALTHPFSRPHFNLDQKGMAADLNWCSGRRILRGFAPADLVMLDGLSDAVSAAFGAWHRLLIPPSLYRVEIVDSTAIPLAFDLRAVRRRQMIEQVG